MAAVECLTRNSAVAADSGPHDIAPPRKSPCNLIMVYRRSRAAHRHDFAHIAKLIEQQAPDIRPAVIQDRWYNALRPQWFGRPTLAFSPGPIRHFWLTRAAAFHGRWISKSEEMLRLERAGVSVPRWALVSKDAQPDLRDFGKYVVVKPNYGARGAEVKIKRTGRVRWKPPRNADAIRQRDDRRLVQQFIYTGPWPVCYRVTTLFGRILFSWRVEACHRRRPLTGPDKFDVGGHGGGGISIVSSGEGCTFALSNEADVLAIGEQAARGFPDIPLLGFDIVRDHATGQLYVVEANAHGHVWHFSSDTGLGIQHDNNINFDRQMGGLQRAAEALIDATRRYAA